MSSFTRFNGFERRRRCDDQYAITKTVVWDIEAIAEGSPIIDLAVSTGISNPLRSAAHAAPRAFRPRTIGA